MDISNAWGYGAIVMPKKLFWQGFVILDPADPRIHDSVARALANATILEGETTPPEGTIAASVVSCFVSQNEIGVAVFSAALSEVIGSRFWVIDTTVNDDESVVTTVVPLEVSSPEAARDAIDQRVMALKMGLALKVMAAKGPKSNHPADEADHKPDKSGK